MTDEADSQDSEQKNQKRFAVFASDASGDKPTYVLTIADRGRVTVGADSNPNVLLELLSEVSEEVRSHAGNGEKDVKWDLVEEKLRERGYRLEEMPTADRQVAMSIDLGSGRVVGEEHLLHHYLGVQNDLGRRIVEAMAMALNPSFEEAAGELASLVSSGEHASAVARLIEIQTSSMTNPKSAELLTIARSISVAGLTGELQKLLLLSRVNLAGALKDYGLTTETELGELFATFASELSTKQKGSLRNLQGLVANAAGRSAQAALFWEKAIQEGDDSGKGWGYRNLARSRGRDPSAQLLVEKSVAAFLCAGERTEAARSSLFLVRLLPAKEQQRMLSVLDEAIQGFNPTDLGGRDVRAKLEYGRAELLWKLGDVEAAREGAARAATLLIGIMGAENERAGCLALEASLAKSLGEHEAVKQLELEIRRLVPPESDPEIERSYRAQLAFAPYDSTAIAALVEECREARDDRNLSSLLMMRGISEGTPEEKIEWLEEARTVMRRAERSDDDESVVLGALANALVERGDREQALARWLEVLELDPFDPIARNNVPALLWQLERWSDLTVFLRKQLGVFGELPGLLLVLGRALLKLGSAQELREATSCFLRARAMFQDDKNKEMAQMYFDEAVGLGAAVDPLVERRPEELTLTQLRSTIDQFAVFIAKRKRMQFWRRDKDSNTPKRKWTENPERLAQNLLDTFLSARFDAGPSHEIEIAEELDVGAGRLDLLVRSGSFKAVLELKMLGAGKSKPYAFSGKEQITHYMENEQTSVGILVIFDSRIDGFGEGLKAIETVGKHTVYVVFVDVRPRVTS